MWACGLARRMSLAWVQKQKTAGRLPMCFRIRFCGVAPGVAGLPAVKAFGVLRLTYAPRPKVKSKSEASKAVSAQASSSMFGRQCLAKTCRNTGSKCLHSAPLPLRRG